jgi:iron complex transport system permease protein
VRIGATLCVLLLTGGATAVAGPVGFVGVMTPHVARLLVGVDYRRLVPMAALLGAGLTVLADTCARTLGGGQEVPLGLFTTLIGAPFFVALARRRAEHHALQG